VAISVELIAGPHSSAAAAAAAAGIVCDTVECLISSLLIHNGGSRISPGKGQVSVSFPCFPLMCLFVCCLPAPRKNG